MVRRALSCGSKTFAQTNTGTPHMRSHLVRKGTIIGVNRTTQIVEIQDSHGVIHTQEISPNLPSSVWLSTCGYLVGLQMAVVETEDHGGVTVIEPDALIDVSEAASAVGTSYTGHLSRRLRTSSTREATVEGSLINGIFDLLVLDPEMSDDDCLRRAAATRPLALALLARLGSADDMLSRIRSWIPALREMRSAWVTEQLDLEPFYMSPRFGLQGRADIVRRIGNTTRVVEMKAGKPPSATNRLRNDHAAQVAGYVAILGSIEPSQHIEAFVWYVKAGDEPLVPVSVPQAIGPLIAARNTIFLSDLALKHGSVEPLRWLGGAADGGSSYEFSELQELNNALRGCTKDEILAVRAWMSMASALHHAVRIGGQGQRCLSDVWKLSNDDKMASPNVLTGCLLDPESSDFSTFHIVFRRPSSSTETTIRVGDQIIGYPLPSGSDTPCEGAMFKGVVRDISAKAVKVAFRNKFINASVFQNEHWVIEQDVMDGTATSFYTGLRSFINAEPRRRAVLLGAEAPKHLDAKRLDAEDCTPDQLRVIERALASAELMLIQGPPGTGKTSTIIRRIIQELVADNRERLLAVAYTNRAANELCAVLDRHGIAYLRHGSVEGTEGAHAIPHLARTLDPGVLAQRIADARCIVATVQSMYSGSEIWEFGTFTTAIVDEASQILEPSLLGIVSRVGRSIMVGDQCQLPPVLALDPASVRTTHPALQSLGLSALDGSAFERLIVCADARGDSRSTAMLTQQGRMHSEIMRIVSDTVYGGNLEALLPWQRDMKATAWSDVLPYRTVFIPVADDDQAMAEAECIIRLVTQIDSCALRDDDAYEIGIITPFRLQNTRIRDLLPTVLRSTVTVDTVERFQGSERDIIIYGTAVSSSTELSSIESHLVVHGRVIDRKLNVAITRARKQLVVIGNEHVLMASAPYREMLNQLKRPTT